MPTIRERLGDYSIYKVDFKGAEPRLDRSWLPEDENSTRYQTKRIADALERIADALEAQGAAGENIDANDCL